MLRRKPRPETLLRWTRLLLVGGMCCVSFLTLNATVSLALDPAKRIAQFGHTAWRLKDGHFNSPLYAITQTVDGYVWLGTESGVWRFDGVRFVQWTPPKGSPALFSGVTSLLGSRDGSLWIGTPTGLLRWKDQTVTSFPDALGMIHSIEEIENGEIWFTSYQPFGSTNGVCQVTGSNSRCYGKEDGLPNAGSLVLTKDPSGKLWVGTAEGLTRWKPGSATAYGPAKLKNNRAQGISAVVPMPDNSLWVGIALPGPGLGLQRFANGSWETFVTPQFDGSKITVTALLRDRSNTLWVGSTEGLYRISEGRVDHFQRADGLSGDFVVTNGLLEDREGNIWVATALGIDCFRDLPVSTFDKATGLSTDGVDAILASRNGTILAGGPGALSVLQMGDPFSVKALPNLPGHQVTTLLEDRAGRLWAGIDNSLWVYDKGAFRQIKYRDGKPVGFVVGMTEDVAGNVWAETAGEQRILIRVQNFQVQEEFPQLPIARKLAADPKSGIWLGLVSGDLARFADGKLEVFPFKQSATPGYDSLVNELLVNPDGSVMGATFFGVIAWKDGRQQSLTMRNGLPCQSIYTLITDNHGTLWLYAQCGLMAITNSELQKWWTNPDAIVAVKVLDALDGIRPGVAAFNGSARSPDGKLWFTNNTSIQMVDPDRLGQDLTAPLVHVEKVIANKKEYELTGDLSLPPITRDLEISFTAPSFTMPQRVLFRYLLEGHDEVWQDAGTRRLAFYSDLPPGYYRFRVMASNSAGVWNEVGASFAFRILPAWYQTVWFHGFIAVAVVFVLWLIHHLRVRQVAYAVNVRADARLAERSRLARELHDTFIQTIEGSKLVVDDALDKPTDPESMQRALTRLAVWLDQAIQEGRTALNSLRDSTTERNDLRDALQRATESGFIPSSMSVSLTVIGEPQEMHPIIRDEVYRIGYEAIRNASQHSHATRLHIELSYGRELTLRVSDNGAGIDPVILEQGRDGHFGLQSMRERAARIAGNFTIVSNNNGTAITLVVPEGMVYQAKRRNFVSRVLRRIARVFK